MTKKGFRKTVNTRQASLFHSWSFSCTGSLKAAFFFAILLLISGLRSPLNAYEVWLGTHKWEGAAADNLNQWNRAIEQIDGINYVLLDSRPNRPAGDGANASDWNTMIAPIDQATTGMGEIARSQYQPAQSRTLAERLQNEFATVENRGGVIDIMMLYDEERNGTVYNFTLEDAQEVRDWLDNNGEAHVTLCFNLRNNDQERLALAQQPIFDSVMIEASATRWVEDRFNLHTLLQDLWTDPRTSAKDIHFQIPRSESPGTVSQRDGKPTSPINQYIETRRALWTIKDLMGDAFMQSDQAIFIVCNYGDTFPTYPETENNGTRYVNSKSGIALSLIEQRAIFEGRTGVVDEALCASYDRFEVTLAPDFGLVAHWPLDEGSGILATDASGFGGDGMLLNGASWASDATRRTHVVFDGTDDRIATNFRYALAEDDDFTWAWWANKADPAGTKSGSIMVGNRYGNSGAESFEFIKLTPASGQFANTNSAASIEGYNYPDLTNDGWHHYAMVKSGTSYQWYVDGAPQGSPTTINYDESSLLPFLIGGDDDGSGTKVNEHFKGALDDVILYREALTPAEISNVINGNYFPIVTLTTLGSPVDGTDGSVWSNAQPARSGIAYVVPANGNLRGESGLSTFAGASLTVEAGGRFQVRAIEPEVTTVEDLILAGGTSFAAGQFAELAAGTGSSVTNVIDGKITQSGTTRLVTFDSVMRRLKVLSQISGDGTLQVIGEGAVIDNSGNLFSGLWQVASGSELVFENAQSVGSGNVEVQSGATLEVKGDWLQEASLTVANSSGTEVKVGPYEWALASLLLGGSPVADGIYTPSELSNLSSTLFSGTGRITVGTPPLSQEIMAGWDFWNSNTTPSASVTASGITATASASTSSGSWTTTDNGSSGRGSSGDGTWGSFDGKGVPASTVTAGTGSNLTASNGVSTAELTLTITNNGPSDWELDAFHMDAVALRPNAPRAYELRVLSGDLTPGVVFTSADDVIPEVGGTLSGNNDDHQQIDISLIALADSTLEVNGTAVLRITFSSGTGSGGGHHLFLDNVAVSGTPKSLPSELESWRLEAFGTLENSGLAANDFDADNDGESNLLEFATGQNPHAATLLSTPLEMNGNRVEYRYPRNTAALADGMIFTVEWSDTLLPGSWSSNGVRDTLDTANPGTSELENRLATIPQSLTGKRFLRLHVSNPVD